MSAEMANESMEIITMSVDKHQPTKNYEVFITCVYILFITQTNHLAILT
jgi:hypothetical protein